MTLIMPPRTGEDVSILAPHSARLRGHVTGRGPKALTIELEQPPIRRPFRFSAGSGVEVEWVHPLGVMQLSATVESARDHPRPTLELGLVGTPEPVERREHDRVPIELAISVWTLMQSTRRLAGNTIDISPSGALLWLPELSPLAGTVDVRIALPGEPVHAFARVMWRREPALVGVDFEHIDHHERARLVSFLRDSR